MSVAFIPPADLAEGDVLAQLAPIVAASLRIDPGSVVAGTSLDALGAESIDVIEITLDVEHAFTVLMPERTVLQLATEVAGEGTFERDGRLTDLGSLLLGDRMPEIEPSLLAPGVPVRELTPLFLRVDVWIRVIQGLLRATPRTCPRCAGRLVQGAPARVRCPACRLDIALPSGDEVARAWVRDWLAARRA